ncbi:uncharacterized protein LOC123697414 [Colias croceus]|uniref:uncharacterized protein LOC123697414 n=1 Tax=Colias crocea TaxID=72248 RepID=UPI001E27F497|nr:uncharacterized protein LOC123697414 [Colias croceus]
MSNEMTVTEGTAQGSVLGPLLYLAYVNDMEHVINHCSIYQYADDTCLIASDKNINTAAQQLQEDFTRILMWSHDAGLVINVKKTKIVHVHSSHLKNFNNFKITAHNHVCLHKATYYNPDCSCECVDQVPYYTYLGLIVDNRFNWNHHINYVCDKLRAILSKFYIIRNKIPYKILLSIYRSLAESIIQYGITSYGRTFNTYIDRITNLQLRLIKKIVPINIKNKFKDKPLELFSYCNVLPIRQMFQKFFLIEQFHKINFQNPISHQFATRQITNNKLIIPKVHNFYGKRTANFLLPTILNSMPQKVKKDVNIKNYKIIYKRYFHELIKTIK